MRHKQGVSQVDDINHDNGNGRGRRRRLFGLGWGRLRHRANRALTLSDVAPGTSCIIHRLYGQGPARQRLLDLGFQPGRRVQVLRNAPLNDPIEVRLGDTFIALRRQEAERVEVDQDGRGDQSRGEPNG